MKAKAAVLCVPKRFLTTHHVVAVQELVDTGEVPLEPPALVQAVGVIRSKGAAHLYIPQPIHSIAEGDDTRYGINF